MNHIVKSCHACTFDGDNPLDEPCATCCKHDGNLGFAPIITQVAARALLAVAEASTPVLKWLATQGGYGSVEANVVLLATDQAIANVKGQSDAG